jgi:hypothetical protein
VTEPFSAVFGTALAAWAARANVANGSVFDPEPPSSPFGDT